MIASECLAVLIGALALAASGFRRPPAFIPPPSWMCVGGKKVGVFRSHGNAIGRISRKTQRTLAMQVFEPDSGD